MTNTRGVQALTLWLSDDMATICQGQEEFSKVEQSNCNSDWDKIEKKTFKSDDFFYSFLCYHQTDTILISLFDFGLHDVLQYNSKCAPPTSISSITHSHHLADKYDISIIKNPLVNLHIMPLIFILLPQRCPTGRSQGVRVPGSSVPLNRCWARTSNPPASESSLDPPGLPTGLRQHLFSKLFHFKLNKAP